MFVKSIREFSLRQRLLLLTLLTSGVGLMLGCAGFLAYDMHAAREQKVEQLQSAADLVGTNGVAPLAFDDAISGKALLQALHTRQHLRMGVLHRADGSFFASFVRADLTGRVVAPEAPPEGIAWGKKRLTLTSPIFMDGRRVGSLYLETDLTDLEARLRRLEFVAVLIGTGSLLVAYLLTAAMQRSISGPVLNLARIARCVATEKTYS